MTKIDGNPVEPGTYVVNIKVEVTQSDSYNLLPDELTADDWKFTISYLKTPETPYTIKGDYTDTERKIVWIRQGHEAAIIPASGYTISADSSDAPDSFEDQLTYGSDQNAGSISVSLMDGEGHITDKVKIAESIKVDNAGPSGEITVKDDIRSSEWKKDTSYDAFIKDGTTLSITVSDGESGVSSVQYCILTKQQVEDMKITDSASDEDAAKAVEAAAADADGWKTYDAEKKITLSRGSQVVYAKLTDRTGNIRYLCTEGLHVYEAISPAETELTYTRSSGQNVTLSVNLNGNTLADLALKVSGSEESTVLKEEKDYTVKVEEDAAEITLHADWMQTLSAGNYQLSVKYNPLGATFKEGTSKGDAPETEVLSLTVERCQTTSDLFVFKKPSSLIYNGKEKTANVSWKEGLTGTGEITVKYYDSKGNQLESAPVKPGNYTVKIDVAQGDDYAAATDITDAAWKFTIYWPDTSYPEEPGYSISGGYTDAENNSVWIRDGGKVQITAREGHLISTERSGEFTEQIEISKETAAGTLYLYEKRSADGKISDKFPVAEAVKIDAEAPVSTIQVQGKTVLTSTTDSGSGVAEVAYCVIEKAKYSGESGAEAIEQLVENAGGWKTSKTDVTISLEDGEYIICVRATDHVGNTFYVTGEAGTAKEEPVSIQSQIVLAKVKPAKTSAVISWNKVTGADGYYIYAGQCNTSKKSYSLKKVKEIKSGSIVKYTYKGLKKNTWYKYRVTAYKVVNGKKVVIGKSLIVHSLTGGSKVYADPAKVTVSKKIMTLKKGKSAKITAKMVLPKNKKTKYHTAKIRYVVSDTNIVSVSKSGTVKAKKKGTCTVYAVAQNGVWQKIRITVR